MAPLKARPIREVRPYTNKAGVARCVVTLESGEKLGLSELSRNETLKAASILFPKIPGNRFFKATQDALRAAILAGDPGLAIEGGFDAVPVPEGEDHDGQGDETPITPQEAPKAPTGAKGIKRPAKAPTSAEAALEALRDLLGGGGVDAEQLQAAVVTEVARAIADAPIVRHEIKLPDREAKLLPDTSHAILPKVVEALGVGVNLFLVGPAGSGKSTIGEQAADALGLKFYALSLGPTTPTSKLFGYNDATGNYVRTPFREAYENGGLFLLDELDNGHPGLVAELNQATANTVCAFADGNVTRHAQFKLLATGNTFGRGPDRQYVGRNILDAATLDRFLTLECPIDEKLERAIALSYSTTVTQPKVARWVDRVQAVRAEADKLKLNVVVSPRSSIDGAKLLTAGWSEAEVAEARVFAGLGSETRSKLERIK